MVVAHGGMRGVTIQLGSNLKKEALKIANWVLMGPGGRKINEYVYEKAIERRRKLFVTYGEFGRQIHRPAVKLSK